MKNLLLILTLFILGCTKTNVGKCYLDGQGDPFTVVDQDGHAYVKVYFEMSGEYLRAFPLGGNEVSCSLVERYLKFKGSK
jgi:hypothetical protein